MSEEPPDRQTVYDSDDARNLFLFGVSSAQHYNLKNNSCTRYSRSSTGTINETRMEYSPAEDFVRKHFPEAIESAHRGERKEFLDNSNGAKDLVVRTNLSRIEISVLLDNLKKPSPESNHGYFASDEEH